jgi:hypothetical protein
MEKEKSTQVTGCKTCKKGMSGTQKWLLVISIYIFTSSIYGTIELIKLIADWFK